MDMVSILQFVLAKGSGQATLKKLFEYINKNKKYSLIDLCLDAKLIEKELLIKIDIANNIVSAKKNAEILSYELYKNSIELVCLGEDKYPTNENIRQANLLPPLLFVKGNKELLLNSSIGFCGSRKSSEKGIEITSNCSKQLVENDFTIVSGYAAGVDLTAHKSALENKGNTIFVLAEGLLKSKIKRDIMNELTNSNHLFVSQFSPNLIWNATNAMARNGTIIALSKAMILVESGISGGTFAAGKKSLEVNCPLFVIDYANPAISAEANPDFIKKGGLPIRGKKNGEPNLNKLYEKLTKEPNSIQNDKGFNLLVEQSLQLSLL